MLRHPTPKKRRKVQKTAKELTINVVSELRAVQGQFDIVGVMAVLDTISDQ